MLEQIAKLEGFVPFFQSLTWAFLIVIGIRIFRVRFDELLKAIIYRVEMGSSVKAGVFELGELEDLERVEPSTSTDKSLANQNFADVEVRAKQRQEIYSNRRNLFIAHLLTPSKLPEQKYDIYMYLIRHPDEKLPSNLSDVVSAEFYFGKYWGNRVFEATRVGSRIGVATSAYGSFLCTCRVRFEDGYEIILDKYIDFEMAQYIPKTTE